MCDFLVRAEVGAAEEGFPTGEADMWTSAIVGVEVVIQAAGTVEGLAAGRKRACVDYSNVGTSLPLA